MTIRLDFSEIETRHELADLREQADQFLRSALWVKYVRPSVEREIATLVRDVRNHRRSEQSEDTTYTNGVLDGLEPFPSLFDVYAELDVRMEELDRA